MCEVFLLVVLAIAGLASGNPSSRLVGGKDAPANRFTYAVSIRSSIQHQCTGSILTENYVLTAAHCCQHATNERLVYAGSHSLSSGGSYHAIEKFISHEDFNKSGSDLHNDICLVQLLNPIILSESATKTTLTTAGKDVPNFSTVTVMGWGHDDPAEQHIPDKLQYHDMFTSYSSMFCSLHSNDSSQLTGSESTLCVIGRPGSSVCAGDSGGPLVYKDVQVGVFSYYLGFCGTPFPDIYTKVSYYIDWIKTNVGDDSVNLKFSS